MKDAEQLDLLKEIGGTRVYEECRCKSLKIMQETGKWFIVIVKLVVCCICWMLSYMFYETRK